jgi:hypothetical protein
MNGNSAIAYMHYLQWDGPTGQVPELLTRHWNHRKYGAGALGCSTRERTVSKIIRNFGTRPQKYMPALSRPKKFEECRLKGR